MVVTAIWAATLWGFYHVVETHIRLPRSNPLPVVGYFAGMVALAGWMIQAKIATRNSRKQHTMNVLFQTRMSKEFQDHVDRITKKYPDGAPIPYEEIILPENADVFASVRFILNYYEFIAVGIEHGDLDEPLIRSCICSQFCTFCRRSDSVIRSVRGEDERGDADPTKERFLRAARKLQRRWQKRIDRSVPPWVRQP